jgi:hypothetical protein
MQRWRHLRRAEFQAAPQGPPDNRAGPPLLSARRLRLGGTHALAAFSDTTTPHGRLMLTVLGGLAEFERELIRARTGEGRERAKTAGVRFGRPSNCPPINSGKLCSAPKRKLVEGWPLEAIALHLEAITFGDINRLLINVPPGFMKSLMLNVFWPAWEWGPMNMPYLRHLAFSYAQDLTTRDNNKLVKLVTSPQYQALWSDRFTMVKIGEHRPENDKTGFVLATSVTGVSTGERGDRVRLDDPHNVVKTESDDVMEKTVRFFRESMSNRLNGRQRDRGVYAARQGHRRVRRHPIPRGRLLPSDDPHALRADGLPGQRRRHAGG